MVVIVSVTELLDDGGPGTKQTIVTSVMVVLVSVTELLDDGGPGTTTVTVVSSDS